ncbi:MAG: flavodoxin-dependent (E)-4-hydroxy-3-methylbut-2-enyl-diphosphate synthase [Thermincolia bacterium]
MYQRRKTRQIKVGSVAVGGDAPISVQSMTNTDTRDATATVEQINQLAAAGCEIVRVAVLDTEAAVAIKEIKSRITIPLIADIHFDYKLALEAMINGVDGLRINPGNIGTEEKVQAVVDAAKDKGIPIRIGVNAGSLEKKFLERYGHATPQAMVESALSHVAILEKLNFRDIKISLKASYVPLMLDAYRLLAGKVDYPLHIGVTEAGTVQSGTIKSSVGIGALLAEGIGDTIRVSLTGHPVHEIRVGYEILKSLGLRERGPVLISCPTCGRCQINLIQVAEEVEQRIQHLDKPLKIAIMGCIVNGPGEAREADIGIAGGKGVGLLFKKGEIVRKVPEEQLVETLLEEIERLTGSE